MKLVELLIDRWTVMLMLKLEAVIRKVLNYKLEIKLVQLMQECLFNVSKASNVDSVFGLVSV